MVDYPMNPISAMALAGTDIVYVVGGAMLITVGGVNLIELTPYFATILVVTLYLMMRKTPWRTSITCQRW